MDGRWEPCSTNSFRDVRVLLHPTASLKEVREGFENTSDDSFDLTPFLTAGTQTQFEVTVTLAFRRELFGSAQPRPDQVLEVQLKQKGVFKILWLGIVDAISSFTMSKGERSMQLIARTRDSHDIWRVTKRVTPLFPMLTDLVYIARRVAESAGMTQDEILLPISAFLTRHSNTQFAEMTAWDMIVSIFLALGWTPFIDGLGRLRAANRELQGRLSDTVVPDNRMVKIGASRSRSPVSRVRLKWLDPIMRMHKQPERKLNTVNITMGWWLPYWKQRVYFSDDKSQRAANTRMEPTKDEHGHVHGVNSLEQFGIPVHFVHESYEQKTETYGEAYFNNIGGFSASILALIGLKISSHHVPDPVVTGGVGVEGGETVPTTPGSGGFIRYTLDAVWLFMMVAIGSGQYDILGQPVDYLHPRNTTDAFDISAPKWADNPNEIENDLIIHEGHAKAVAVRELIFQARSANKWTVTIVDDPRIELGDIVEFTDGTKVYVEDVSRQLGRGSEAVLELRGFLVGAGVLSATSQMVISGQTEDTSQVPDPGGPPVPPDYEGPGPGGSSQSNPIIVGPTGGPELDAAIQASWAGTRGGIIPEGDLNYWRGQSNHPSNGFTDRKWHYGWNRYWEERMRPDNTGSANPDYASLPAFYQP
jgi:hypothetical protein